MFPKQEVAAFSHNAPPEMTNVLKNTDTTRGSETWRPVPDFQPAHYPGPTRQSQPQPDCAGASRTSERPDGCVAIRRLWPGQYHRRKPLDGLAVGAGGKKPGGGPGSFNLWPAGRHPHLPPQLRPASAFAWSPDKLPVPVTGPPLHPDYADLPGVGARPGRAAGNGTVRAYKGTTANAPFQNSKTVS